MGNNYEAWQQYFRNHPRQEGAGFQAFQTYFADRYAAESGAYQKAREVAQAEGHGDAQSVWNRWIEEGRDAVRGELRQRQPLHSGGLDNQQIQEANGRVPQIAAREYARVVQRIEQASAARDAGAFEQAWYDRYGRWPTAAEHRAAGFEKGY